MFAGENDLEAVRRGGEAAHKEINRTNLTRDAVADALKKDVVRDQLALLRMRNTCPAFDFDADMTVRQPQNDQLEIIWEKDGSRASLRANLTMWTIDDRYETMPWDELDAVVFDVGNVLLSYSPEEELEAFFPGETELHEKLMEKIIKTPYWNMMDRGTLTVQQAIGHMTGRDRALEPMIRRFMENWLDFTRPIEEGVQAVKSCLAHGKRVFVLSNYQKESFATVESRFDFFGLFEGKVVSAREGLLKPNADIYEFLTNTYRVEPSRTLFIDDTPANIEGAMYVGWQGFCFNRPGKLAAFVGERKG